MLVKEMIKLGEVRLIKAHCMDAKIDAESLYCYLMNVDKVKLFLQAKEPVDKDVVEAYFALIERRAQRIPLQHITGTQQFMGLEFEVDENVLIPRQDTEVLVEEAAKIMQGRNESVFPRKKWNVLDLCCGSGAIGISLAKICANAKITATDVSVSAIEAAQKNSLHNRVKIKFLEGDLYAPIGSKRFDMIVSNPPYIKTYMIPILQDEVKEHEPILALDGGKDGLDFYRRIITEASHHLKSRGVLALEIGHDQAMAVTKLIRDTAQFTKVQVVKDVPGKDRVVYANMLY